MAGLGVWSASCGGEDPTGPAPTLEEPGVLVSGFRVPDGLAVIAEDEFLFAERYGGLFHYRSGEAVRVPGIPVSRTRDVYGGFLDVSLHPEFEDNRWVYIAYNDAGFGLTVARFEFRNGQAEGLQPIFESGEFSIGSRIVWEDPSHFFVSFGIGGSPYPDPGPQDVTMDVGKIHRLRADGSVPVDNPLLPGASQPSSVFSWGHRNPQGLHFDAVSGTLYANEHGPLGGDELNVVDAGANYGWPLFSYGVNYDGSPVSDLSEEEARESSALPLKAWGTDFRVAPSGLLYVPEGGEDGHFLMGAMYRQALIRYDPAQDLTQVVLAGIGRVRDLARLPGGGLLIAVDAGSPTAAHSGRIIQLTPEGELP